MKTLKIVLLNIFYYSKHIHKVALQLKLYYSRIMKHFI